MTVDNGYGDEPTHIKIEPRDSNIEYFGDRKRVAELWIDQTGVVRTLVGKKQVPIKPGKKYKDFEVMQDQKNKKFTYEQTITTVQGHETLAYITLDELLALRDECNRAIQELVK